MFRQVWSQRQQWQQQQQQEMAPNFLSIMWLREAFHGLRIQDVKSLILFDALFLLDGRKRREGKKEKKRGKKE
jgi:hypothetical protein